MTACASVIRLGQLDTLSGYHWKGYETILEGRATENTNEWEIPT